MIRTPPPDLTKPFTHLTILDEWLACQNSAGARGWPGGRHAGRRGGRWFATLGGDEAARFEVRTHSASASSRKW